MRNRRAFTLIELMIVVAIVSITTIPVLAMYQHMYAYLHTAALTAGLKAESASAAHKIFRLAAANGGYGVDPDNRGLRFKDGWLVRWQGDRLTLIRGKDERPLTEHKVVAFTAVRRDGVLTLNLTLETPAHAHGPPVRFRDLYDYPSIGGSP